MARKKATRGGNEKRVYFCFQDALAAARKKHADELTRVKKLLEKETQSRQALEADLAAVRQSIEQKSASQAESNEQLSALRKALVKEQDARAAAEAKLAESRESSEELKTEVDTLTAENERLRAEVEGLRLSLENLK